MARYQVNNSSVEALIGDIKSGNLVIPEMQRPFVWNAKQVRDLIDSLYKGFPVGYIIVWKNPDVRLKNGKMEIGKTILIDGQQRITALAAAIVGKKVIDDHYKETEIKIAFNPEEEVFEVANSANQKSSRWIHDISSIFATDFDSWQFVEEYCNTNEIRDKSKINKVINNLRLIQGNFLGVTTLDDKLDIDDVTEIFIRINSKGVVLSQADFAMSKIAANVAYRGNIIRKTIDYFCRMLEVPTDINNIQDNDAEFVQEPEFNDIKWAAGNINIIYKTSYVDVLRVAFTYKFQRGKLQDLVSLLSGRDFATREYKAEIAEESFKMLNEAVREVVNKTNYERFTMIVRSAGFIKSSMIRSKNVLNFGYALYLALRERKVPASNIEKIVRCWLVLSILTGRYSGSPESMFDYDIKRFFNCENANEYLQLTEAGDLSDAFWNVTLPQRLDTSVSSSPYFSIFLAAQAKAHDKGFLSDQIEVANMLENKGDVHHLFPKAYLMRNGFDKGMYNKIANYAYIQQEINIRISDDAPCTYMHNVMEQFHSQDLHYGGIKDEAALGENFKQNCIPDGFVNMAVDDYENFLTKRRKLMAEKIHVYYENL